MSISLSRMNEIRKTAENFGNVAAVATVIGVVGALAYKVAGVALSLLTGGRLTLLGAVIVSSPYFYIPLTLVGVSSVLAFTIERVCSNLIKN